MKIGDRARVSAPWSEFCGMVGHVTQVSPCVMVLLEGYVQPLRIDPVSLTLDAATTRSPTAAQ